MNRPSSANCFRNVLKLQSGNGYLQKGDNSEVATLPLFYPAVWIVFSVLPSSTFLLVSEHTPG